MISTAVLRSQVLLAPLLASAVIAPGLAACSSGDDGQGTSAEPAITIGTDPATADATSTMDPESPSAPTDTTDTTDTTDPEPATESTDSSPVTRAPAVTEPPTTEPNVIVPVDVEGSVRGVISSREDLSNFSSVIDRWLLDDSGLEGVLRNPRGITLFVPNNDGFTEADVETALADLDAFTLFLTAHLKVGPARSSEFGESVMTADGSVHPVGFATIGGRALTEVDLEATNGFVHVIDGKLAEIVPL